MHLQVPVQCIDAVEVPTTNVAGEHGRQVDALLVSPQAGSLNERLATQRAGAPHLTLRRPLASSHSPETGKLRLRTPQQLTECWLLSLESTVTLLQQGF